LSRAKGFSVITLVSTKAPGPLGPALEAAWPLDRDFDGFDALLDAIDQAEERSARSELEPMPPAQGTG
jgi:hypothetical protein